MSTNVPTLDTSSLPENVIVDDTSISPTRSNKEGLEKKLSLRPDVQDLKNRHILLDTNAAPSIQAAQHELEKQKITDNLKKGLEHRSERDVLVERNILPDSSAAPALQKNQKELEKHMRRDSLEKKLQERPKVDELIREGIIEADEDSTKV